MKIYFVRHGHSDPKNGLLTELGHLQAKIAAKRLSDCDIERIFSSTVERALETAAYTAEALGLTVEHCDFMREIKWNALENEDIPNNGHPWANARMLIAEGKDIRRTDWQRHEPFCRSVVGERVKTVTEGLDAWLQTLGYTREGDYYRVNGTDTDHTVAMFSHGGSSTVALSHMLGIPFPQACAIFHIENTSVTVMSLANEQGKLIVPRLEVCGDAEHIKDLRAEHFYGM